MEEKPGKQEHGPQHEGAHHHQPHVAAVGERGHSGLLCRDHVGQVQHVAQGPARIAAANLKQERTRISAGRYRHKGSGCTAEVAISYAGRALSTMKTHLSKEVDPLPVLFSEFVAIFQEREDVGSREAIFAQVLFFYLVIRWLHLGGEEGTGLLHTASRCSSLCLSIHCRCRGDLLPLALEVTPNHLFTLQKNTSSSCHPAAPAHCHKHCSPHAKAGHRSSQWRWSLCPGQRGFVHRSGSKSSSQSRKQKKPEGERIF